MRKNTLIRLDKPHIRKRDGRWLCGTLIDVAGPTPVQAYAAWQRAMGWRW